MFARGGVASPLPGRRRPRLSAPTGALIDTEMLAKARNLGLSIGQAGVHHYPRIAGQQTGANLRVILRAFKELFQLYRKIGQGRPRAQVPPHVDR